MLILKNLSLDYNTSLISNGVGNCYWNCKRKDVCRSTTNITFGLQVSQTENRCNTIVRIEIYLLYDISLCFFRVTRFILYIIIKVESFNCRATTATAIARNLQLSFWQIAVIVTVPAVFGPSRRENAVALSISVLT